jgi:hypothetical protein
MNTLSVKNFERFQHYKDRTPPWIKLYNELLDDYEFGMLPDASKWHLIAIWLLASRSNNKIPHDPEWISRRINAVQKVDLAPLIDGGFLVVNQPLQEAVRDASTPLAKRSLEKEGETDNDADQSAHQAMTDTVWRTCPSKLEKLGVKKNQARSFVGRCLKSAEPGAVLEAIDAAFKNGTKDPCAYITAALKDKSVDPEIAYMKSL